MTTATRTLDASGVQWASSKAVAEKILRQRPGVMDVSVNPVSQTATVTYDTAITDVGELAQWIRDCGLHCAGESLPDHLCDVEAAPAAGHDGRAHHVTEAPASHTEHSMHQMHSPAGDASAAVGPDQDPHAGHAGHAGHTEAPTASPHDVMGHGGHSGMSMADMVADMRNRFLVAALLSVPILMWSPIGREVFGFTVPAPFGLRDDVWGLLLSLPVIFYSAWIFFDGAWRALRARTLDMMVLVAVAVGAGWGYSLFVTLTGGGEVFYEAATVLTAFVLLGHWLEMRARGGANDAVRTLLELAPPRATVLRDGEPIELPTAAVVVGDTLLIRPGAKVPVDAVVTFGESEIDESMVTGESLPVPKQVGSELIGASVNTTGSLQARATKVGADTALAQIVQMVQQAQNSKAPGQRLADRAAFWLVLVALIGGTLTFFGWLAAGATAQEAMLFAITVVVITCPDALGLATPMAVMVGTGLGARRGILFKNAGAIEAAAHIDTVVMDKTGTLTKGEPEVTDVATLGQDRIEVLAQAAAVEAQSEHPLAAAVVRYAAAQGAPALAVSDFRNTPGQGATARVDGHAVRVGSAQLLLDAGIAVPSTLQEARQQLASQGRTAVYVAVDDSAVGVIAMADASRDTAAAAVQALHDRGVTVVMLTGDNEATAARIGAELGIDRVIAGVLPDGKAQRVAELQAAGRTVAMVGDGVNDAPALAQADLGIAIGAGTDVAIETADVVLMRSDPLDVAVALAIGKGTVRKMRQNLGWAVGYNAIALPIAAGLFVPAFGLMLRPEIAALAMSGSSFLVAMNALLLKRLRLPGGAPLPDGPVTRAGRVTPPTVSG